MNMRFFTVVIVFLCACNSKVNDPKAVWLKSIDSLEQILKQSEGLPDVKIARKMISMYWDFAQYHKDDPMAPEYLLRAGDIAGGINDPYLRADCYKFLSDSFPKFNKIENAWYLLAFTYDADLNNREAAKPYYLQVIQSAKDTNLVADSKARMQTIDSLTYDELVQKIIGNNLKLQ
jgi:hypothetical protein